MFHLSHKRDPSADRRFTLSETLAWCHNETGGPFYTLDVCGEALSHVCEDYYSLERAQDGLVLPWYGHVWCNPPWSQLKAWVTKAWNSWGSARLETISMLIPTRTEQPFWQELVETRRDRNGPLFTYFLPKRQQFGNPLDPKGLNAGSPPFNCVLLHWVRIS